MHACQRADSCLLIFSHLGMPPAVAAAPPPSKAQYAQITPAAASVAVASPQRYEQAQESYASLRKFTFSQLRTYTQVHMHTHSKCSNEYSEMISDHYTLKNT